MEALSTMMLSIIAILLCVSVPRIYGDWLVFRNAVTEGDMERLPAFFAAEKQWVQRHFWCAVAAIAVVLAINGTSLGDSAPHLAQATAVYAAISLTLAFVESLFAQKVASLLALTQGRRDDEPSQSQ